MAAIVAFGYGEKTAKKLRLNILSMSQIDVRAEQQLSLIHILYDVSSTHVSQLISEAFKYSHIVLASVTYNLGKMCIRDRFYPYQNISPNTLRCYEPSEKYKAIYHPQIPLRCITVQFDQEFIDQYLQEISGDLEAVSYTHLDVYKRQAFICENKSMIPFL